MQLSWSDPRLSVASDSRRTARYRLLQSWYREQVITADYGEYRVNGGTAPSAACSPCATWWSDPVSTS